MRVIKPSVEILTPLDGAEILKHIERCGRVCYKSEDKITEDSAPRFVKMVLSRGHEAVIEHYSISVRFICDRGVSHEIVRHRLASYCQESTRYCNYSKAGFGNEITVIEPPFLDNNLKRGDWESACRNAEYSYFKMLESDCTPQEARSVLPNSLKTEIIMTANLREWRHFLKLRCAPAAHPQMRQVALELLRQFKERIPVVFDDIE